MSLYFVNDPRTKLLGKLKNADMFGDIAHEIQPCTINIAFALKSGKGTYEENVNEGNTSAKKMSIERRISQDAIFFPYGYKVLIGKVRESHERDYSGNTLLYSYPDPAQFNQLPLVGIPEYLALYTVFNGEFSIKANNETVFNRLPCQEALNVPVAQTVGRNGGALPSIENRSNYTPLFNVKGLAGSRSNKIELKLSDGDTEFIEGDFKLIDSWPNHCFIQLVGYEVLNSSNHDAYKRMVGDVCKCV